MDRLNTGDALAKDHIWGEQICRDRLRAANSCQIRVRASRCKIRVSRQGLGIQAQLATVMYLYDKLWT